MKRLEEKLIGLAFLSTLLVIAAGTLLDDCLLVWRRLLVKLEGRS